MKLLVTGGAGFIGSHFIRYLFSSGWDGEVVNLDALTYAGNLENLAEVAGQAGYQFVKGDVADASLVFELMSQGFDAVIHFAAETHVDRSILDSYPFMRTNILGTQVLLSAARQFKVERFVYISTDEVYGPMSRGLAREDSPLNPTSPYAASKGAAELLALSYWRTYGLPVIITRSSNNYGPYQFPEKFIPLLAINALRELPLPVYGNGANVRDWLFVQDHCQGLAKVLFHGQTGQIYNLASGCLKTNLEVAEMILAKLGRSRSLIKFVPDRPAHDYRYALDCTKIKAELNWEPATSLEEELAATLDWYQQNQGWWQRIISGEYLTYYERQYGWRLAGKGGPLAPGNG